jgi:hypothetical protein
MMNYCLLCGYRTRLLWKLHLHRKRHSMKHVIIATNALSRATKKTAAAFVDFDARYRQVLEQLK